MVNPAGRDLSTSNTATRPRPVKSYASQAEKLAQARQTQARTAKTSQPPSPLGRNIDIRA